MRPNNPYAAPHETGPAPSQEYHRDAVSFGGVHCPADCWMAFRPGNFFRHLRQLGGEYWISGVLLVLGSIVTVDHWIHGNRVWPFFFFGLAVLSQLFWIWAWQWSRAYRYMRQESSRRYFHEDERFHGFLDDDGIVAGSNRGTSKSPWSVLALAAIDLDRIELQFKSFNHRWRLPSRFFASEDDYHDARRIAIHHLYSADVELGKQGLERLPYSNQQSLADDQIESGRRWDADHWPFWEGRQRVSIEYQPTMKPADMKDTLRVWVIHWTMTVLPILISIPVWLTADRLHFGDWEFLSALLRENLLYIIPTTIALIWYAFRIRREYKRSLQVALNPIGLVASETGYYLQQDDYKFWSQWTPRFEVISTDTTVGWQNDDDDDDPQFLWDREQLGSEDSAELEKLLHHVAGELATTGHPNDPSCERYPHAWSKDS